MLHLLFLITSASCITVTASIHSAGYLTPSFNVCADSGCSDAGSTGTSCFATVGTVNDYNNWNETPQNAKEVRDCICGSDYWIQLTRCRECLLSKNLYPKNAPNDVTPIAAMSTSFCSPDGGRTNTKTIDGWVDGNVYVDQVNRLMPITTIPADEPSPYTGLGGDAVETVIPETVFDSLISAAATETALVSALDASSGVAGQSSNTSPQETLAASTTSSPTMGSGGSPSTSVSSPSTSAMAGDTISSTMESSAPDASSDDSTSGSGSTFSVQFCSGILVSLVICALTS